MAATIAGIVGIFVGGTDNLADDIIATMNSTRRTSVIAAVELVPPAQARDAYDPFRRPAAPCSQPSQPIPTSRSVSKASGTVTAGQVLPVAGIKEKVLAAHRRGSCVGTAGVDVPLKAGRPQSGRPLAHRRLTAPEPLREFAQAPAAVLVVERIGQANRDVLTRCPAAGH